MCVSVLKGLSRRVEFIEMSDSHDGEGYISQH